MSEKIRLSKIIALRSEFSRRNAEKLIDEKKVKLNGKLVVEQGVKAQINSAIEINNAPLPDIEPLDVVRFYKPKGIICSRNDEQGRKSIFDVLPKRFLKYVSVGRLDYNSEGLLLLTNYGSFSHDMELPTNKIKRVYKVRCHGRFDNSIIDRVKKRIMVDGVVYSNVLISVINQNNTNTWLEITLEEGKNREIRKLLAHFNLAVNRLIRISYGDFFLKDLMPSEYKTVRITHLRELRKIYNEDSFGKI